MRGFTGLVAAVVIVAGCAGPAAPSPSVGIAGIEVVRSEVARASADPALAADAAVAINAFGLDLYRLAAQEPGNFVLSPASIAIALSMARVGARGTTAAEMDAVLRGLGSPALAEAGNALDAALATRTGTFEDASGEDHHVSLRIANALFVQRDMRLEPSWLDAMASRYGAGAWLVDFVAAAEAARLAINGWVADQTEDRIPEILAPGDVDADTRLALANAIYLKAAWLSPFLEERTADGPFTRADGSVVSVPLMEGTIEGAGYAEGDGWVALELPYVGRQLAMLVIVPDDFAAFEAAFDPATLDTIVGALEPTKVEAWLPRFDIESKVDLAALLAAIGMPAAFGPGADFSGITTAAALQISEVVHQANMTVDEAGTEAAAATVVVMRLSGAAAHVRVDRPFLLLLRDVPTGTLVFLGRVVDPSQTR